MRHKLLGPGFELKSAILFPNTLTCFQKCVCVCVLVCVCVCLVHIMILDI